MERISEAGREFSSEKNNGRRDCKQISARFAKKIDQPQSDKSSLRIFLASCVEADNNESAINPCGGSVAADCVRQAKARFTNRSILQC